MTPKPWPDSNSEFLLNDFQIMSLQAHKRECRDPNCDWEPDLHLAHHELVRDINEVHLKLLHDRYCMAARFRE